MWIDFGPNRDGDFVRDASPSLLDFGLWQTSSPLNLVGEAQGRYHVHVHPKSTKKKVKFEYWLIKLLLLINHVSFEKMI